MKRSYEYGSAKYFAMCGLGGMLSCGLTHTAMVPVDLVKCRVQVSQALLFSLNALVGLSNSDCVIHLCLCFQEDA